MLYNWSLKNMVNQMYFIKKIKEDRRNKNYTPRKIFLKKTYGSDIKHYFPCWGCGLIE